MRTGLRVVYNGHTPLVPFVGDGIVLKTSTTNTVPIIVDVYTSQTSNVVITDSRGLVSNTSVTNLTQFTINNDDINDVYIYGDNIIKFKLYPETGTNLNVTEVDIRDAMEITDLEEAFIDCQISSFNSVNLPLLTNIRRAWMQTNIVSFPFIDLSNITDATQSWYRTDLVTFPALDMPLCTDISFAWSQISQFTGAFPLIDLSGVLNADSAWFECSMNSFPAIQFDSCLSMNNTWERSGIATIGLINVPVCTSMKSAFNSSKLIGFPLVDTSSVVRMDQCWDDIPTLLTFPNLDYTNAINLTSAWNNCGIQTFPSSDFPVATNMTQCWESSQSLVNTGSVTFGAAVDLSSAWNNCTSLTIINYPTLQNAINLTSMHSNCTSLVSYPLMDISSLTGSNLRSAWKGCTSLVNFPQLVIPSAITNISSTWESCTSLTDFPLINTSNVTNIQATWRLCTGILTFPLMDLTNVTELDYAWEDCSSLLTFPEINLAKGTGFYHSWYDCVSLSSIAVTDFGTAYTSPTSRDYRSTFSGCSSLVCIGGTIASDSSNFLSASGMFTDCTLLVNPDAASQTLITTLPGAVWVNPSACP